MKKIVVGLLLASTLLLGACNNNQSASKASDSKARSERVARVKAVSASKRRAKAKQASLVKAKATSESKAKAARSSSAAAAVSISKVAQAAAASSSSVVAQQAAAASSSKAAMARAQQQASTQQATQTSTPAAQSNQGQQSQGGISYDTNTLTGFLNTYGVSPALYKMQHDGMSAKAALDSLPDQMLTFGEQQTKWQLDHGGKPDGQQ